MWVAKDSTSIVFSASVDNDSLRKPPLLICPTFGGNNKNDRMPYNPFFENITEEQIQEKLDLFRQMNLENMTIAQIQEKIGDLISGHYRTLYDLNPVGLARARRNDNEIFLNTKNLWYPDYSEIDESKWKY